MSHRRHDAEARDGILAIAGRGLTEGSSGAGEQRQLRAVVLACLADSFSKRAAGAVLHLISTWSPRYECGCPHPHRRADETGTSRVGTPVLQKSTCPPAHPDLSGLANNARCSLPTAYCLLPYRARRRGRRYRPGGFERGHRRTGCWPRGDTPRTRRQRGGWRENRNG